MTQPVEIIAPQSSLLRQPIVTPGLKMAPIFSNFATKKRLQQIRPFLHGRVLDLGCGYTRLPDVLAPGQSYTGVDRWESAINYARHRYPEHTFYLQDLDEQTLSLPGAHFDTIVMLAVLEHLHYPETLFAKLHKFITPGGKLLMTTPSPFGDMIHKVGGRMGFFYSEEMVAHVKIYGKGEISRLALNSGYTLVNYQRFLLQTNQLIIFQGVNQSGMI
jgi:2-polyprenyl-3-methyl-5-hydroxy-6-metoxy-1,4-benzoquinol methylase